MSWSIALIGKPENVVAALEEASKKMDEGQSKAEFDDALPHLVGIVKQNFAKEGSTYTGKTVKLEASGSGYSKDDEQIERSLKVSIEGSYITIV
jgi:hypothetical protein